MNKYQHLVQQQFLNNEAAVFKRLKTVYGQSLKDVNAKIKDLDIDIAGLKSVWDNFEGSEEEKAELQSRIQSKIYQKKYQEAIQGQVDGILKDLHNNAYKTVSEYLEKSYDDGFIGAIYDLHGQGIPLIMPLDQEAMVRAVQLDSKISKGLYTHLGENVDNLKKHITAQVSRGIANGYSYEKVAQQLMFKMTGTYDNAGGALAYAMRIARTEGHRIQVQGAMDACYKAKDMGADVVKQWDSTLDDSTRASHVAVDGEIRELDKAFSNGLMFPGDPSGGAAEVVNCRCALLERARWALDDDELKVLQERAEFFGVDKSEQFEDFKKNYLKATEPQKKEYLTKKKLEQKIKDGQKQLADLNDEFYDASGHILYDDIIADFGSLEDFAKGDQLAKLKSIKSQIDALQPQLEQWEDLLDKKLVKAELKKLNKEKILLKDQLDNIDVKTYSGIWKDDVTTLDYPAKKGSIQAKKDYFENKILNSANDIDEMKKWQALYKSVEDFEIEGEKYLKIKLQYDKTTKDLTKLKKSGTMKSPKTSEAFSQDRKDAALWFDKGSGGFSAADKYFDPPSKLIHNAATKQERDGFYTYTAGSGGHNRPLAGFEKPWSKSGTGWEDEFYKGAKNVWIDYEGKGDQIRGLTTLIEKSTYPDDIWLQSGQNYATLEGFLGIPKGTLATMSDAELQQFVGVQDIFHQFLSTAVNEGGGAMFNSRPMKINFFAPQGSQMLYASDVGAFGKGENEMILQRGGTYEITKIYWGNDSTDGGRKKLFVDMDIHPEKGYDLFQQDPNEWQGSRKNYHS